MNTRSKKLIFALLSAAAFGLTSAALQAQEETDTTAPAPGGQRVMNQWGKNAEKPQLSPELKAQVDAFRKSRNEMLQAFRDQYAPEREAIHALMLEYQNGDLTEEEKQALLEEIKAMKDAHRDEVRELRQSLRTEMRKIREQIRQERADTPPEG